MLQSLHIENIAVIKELDVDFDRGFSVLSGETGAGKSIIIDSINMLSGNRISKDIIRSGEEVAIVGAVFTEISDEVKAILAEYDLRLDDSIMIQRSMSRDGRSLVKINGRTVTQGIQKEICRLLINIHGQNDNQRLMNRACQIQILDCFAENEDLLAEYGKLYGDILKVKSELDSIKTSEAEKNRLLDMLEFQLKEINSVNLKDGEEEALISERKRLSNIEKIEEKVNFAYKALYSNEKGSVVTLIDRSVAALDKISDVVPELKELTSKLTDFRYEVEDIALCVKEYANSSESPTAKLDKIESRLDSIAKLKRKYGNTVEEILKFRDNAAGKLDELEGMDGRVDGLKTTIEELEKKASLLATEIRSRRVCAAEKIVNEAMSTLEFLDMPKVKLEISVECLDKLTSNGMDDVEFLISANPGEPLMPLEKIASGGELSRIMLALKSVLSNKDGVNTVIYDEIDAGVSGKTSRKIGIKLKEISKKPQVICVTHSAQIASMADSHYLISKHDEDGRTFSSVKLLDMQGRVNEVARILGGINVTDAQITAAKEMIEEGRQYK